MFCFVDVIPAVTETIKNRGNLAVQLTEAFTNESQLDSLRSKFLEDKDRLEKAVAEKREALETAERELEKLKEDYDSRERALYASPDHRNPKEIKKLSDLLSAISELIAAVKLAK